MKKLFAAVQLLAAASPTWFNECAEYGTDAVDFVQRKKIQELISTIFLKTIKIYLQKII